jgi:hypothetical protein
MTDFYYLFHQCKFHEVDGEDFFMYLKERNPRNTRK